MSARPDGIQFRDSTGRVFGPGEAVAPIAIDELEPWEEQVYTDVAPDAVFGTNEGRLLAEGWNPPRPDVHDVVRRREALRLAMRRLATMAADAGAIAVAINHSDPDEIVAAVARVGVEMWTSANFGTPDSNLSRWAWSLELQYRTLLHRHRVSILRSLVGRESPAARRFRADLVVVETWVDVPPLAIPDYVIHR